MNALREQYPSDAAISEQLRSLYFSRFWAVSIFAAVTYSLIVFLVISAWYLQRKEYSTWHRAYYGDSCHATYKYIKIK